MGGMQHFRRRIPYIRSEGSDIDRFYPHIFTQETGKTQSTAYLRNYRSYQTNGPPDDVDETSYLRPSILKSYRCVSRPKANKLAFKILFFAQCSIGCSKNKQEYHPLCGKRRALRIRGQTCLQEKVPPDRKRAKKMCFSKMKRVRQEKMNAPWTHLEKGVSTVYWVVGT